MSKAVVISLLVLSLVIGGISCGGDESTIEEATPTPKATLTSTPTPKATLTSTPTPKATLTSTPTPTPQQATPAPTVRVTPAPTESLKANVVASYETLNISGGYVFLYHYKLTLSETNGVDVTFDSFRFEYINGSLSDEIGADGIRREFGSNILQGNGELHLQSEFGGTSPEYTFRGTLSGTDANGNPITVSYTISSREYN